MRKSVLLVMLLISGCSAAELSKSAKVRGVLEALIARAEKITGRTL